MIVYRWMCSDCLGQCDEAAYRGDIDPSIARDDPKGDDALCPKCHSMDIHWLPFHKPVRDDEADDKRMREIRAQRGAV